MINLIPEADKIEIIQKMKMATMHVADHWTPKDNPKQKELFEVTGFYDALYGGKIKPPIADIFGYGGAAFGGKTEGFIALGFTACCNVRNVKVGFFRRKFTELEGSDAPIERSLQYFSKVGARYNGSKHVWTFPITNAKFHFHHCQHEKDVYSYQSQAWDILFIDEATQFSWFIIDYLLTRNRITKGSEIIQPFAGLASNPGGVGHTAVMKMFDLEKLKGKHHQVKMVENPNDQEEKIYFIPAFIDDNKEGVKKDPNYRERLTKRDPITAKALIEGDWNVFTGQMFKEFSKNRHCVPDFVIPDHWEKWIGYDWGYDAPLCFLWLAMNPDTSKIYVYREMYKAGLTDPQQARAFIERSQNKLDFNYYWSDPSLWTARTIDEKAKSTADVFKDYGIVLNKANNNNIDKVRKIHQALADGYDGRPNLFIFEIACRNLIRTLPALMTDPKRTDVWLQDQEDHAPDALGYALTHWSPTILISQEARQKDTFEDSKSDWL